MWDNERLPQVSPSVCRSLNQKRKEFGADPGSFSLHSRNLGFAGEFVIEESPQETVFQQDWDSFDLVLSNLPGLLLCLWVDFSLEKCS